MKDGKDKIVITVDGTEAKRSECRYIKKQYYRVGDVKVMDSGHCYFIKDKYYRDDTGYITYDHSIKEYVIKNSTTLVTGVVNINEDGSLVFGDFTIDRYTNIKVVDETGSLHLGLNKDIFNNKPKWYRLCISNGKYHHIKSINATKLSTKAKIQNGYKRSLPYNATEEVMDHYCNIYDGFNPEISEVISKNSKELQDLTFGVEFETTKGRIPENILNTTGLIPLRDGSIKGIEYVTVPMSGDKGVKTLINACESLSKYTENDNSCSLHLHIGNVPRTEKFIIALTRVLSCIQDSMYELFPLYKRRNLGVKRQNYTKELPFAKLFAQMDKGITDDNVVDNFNVIYSYLSGGHSLKDNGFKTLSDVTHHPSDPRGTSKWYIQSRYSWVNMIPLVFGNKKTIEFRIHTGTTDVSKTLNYLFICSAIINYTKRYEKSILKGDFAYNVTLGDIIDTVYSGYLRNELLSYRDNRYYFQESQLKRGKIDPSEDEFIYKNYYINWSKSLLKTVKINFKENHRYVGDGFAERLRRTAGGRLFTPGVGLHLLEEE